MLPVGIIIIFSIIGMVVMDGLIGWFIGGLIGFVIVMLISSVFRYFIGEKGRILPQKVTAEITANFIEANQKTVKAAFPLSSASEISLQISQLLNDMINQAAIDSPSWNMHRAFDADVFLPAAESVTDKQSSPEEQEVARELIYFLTTNFQHYNF